MATKDSLRVYPFEAFRGDLPAELLRMVETEPVSRVSLPDGREVWLVVGYQEASTVLSDPRFTRRSGRHADASPADGCPSRDLSMDGQPHQSLRRMASRAFTARHIEAYRPRVQAITDQLLDRMESHGKPSDLVAALVVPLPALVVYEILGVPRRDQDRFAAWGDAMLSLTAHGSPEAAAAAAELRAYLTEQLTAKRLSPGDDLLSAWLGVQATTGDGLTDDEIVNLAVAVLIGGREISSISVGLRALFLHPDAMARVRANAGLLPAMVEEVLRYTSVSPMFLVQTVTEDLELGGKRLRAGDGVMAVPWAANRSPSVFTNPHSFDLDRPQNPHLTFGLGAHFCLGAALGRLQVEIAIGTLLRRFPALAPAIPLAELPWRDHRMNCGLAALPVTW